MSQDSIDFQSLGFQAARIFTPSTPVSRKALFAGRKDQLLRVIDVIFAEGQHGIIYGERGVGKTSLSNILHESLVPLAQQGRNFVVARINCDQTDNFSSAWIKMFKEVRFFIERPAAGFNPEVIQNIITYGDVFGEGKTVKPTDVRQIEQVSNSQFIFIFDEFDRLFAPDAASLFADTIKMLSDHASNITIILIGVADSVDQLIRGHASIDRSLMQVLMPRMQPDELRDIINKGLAELGMSIESNAEMKIVELSQGLPHYTHSISLSSAREALRNLRLNITSEDVKAGISTALTSAQQTIINSYNSAVVSPRQGTLFKQVLLACAMSGMDELGYFSPVDVKKELRKILKREVETSGFIQHLIKFTSEQRSCILKKRGEKRHPRFRFSNPLMQPFVIMKGIQSGLI